jgi:hypothetical protein
LTIELAVTIESPVDLQDVAENGGL